MEVGDLLSEPRALEHEATRSARVSRDAARLCVLAGAVVSAARDVRARSQQLVSTTQRQRWLRNRDDEVAAVDPDRIEL